MKKGVLIMKSKIILGISALLMTATIAIQPMTSQYIDKGNVGNTTAKVETWAEQTWKDKWIGTGFWQTRTLYTINPIDTNTSKTKENRRYISSATNNTSVTQSIGYTYDETRGHTVSAEIKGQKKHFEAAVGYSFSYATAKSYNASLSVPPRKTYYIYQSDMRIKQQYTVYKKQPQRANNLTATKWVNNGKAKSSSPLIKEYRGVHFDFV